MKQIRQRVITDRSIAGGRRIDLELRLPEDAVPAALLLPSSASAQQKAAGVLLLHGLTADKEMMARTVGLALVGRGIASLSLDLPLHGGRATGNVRHSLGGGAMELVRHWQTAMAEAELGISYLGARPELDREHIAVVGYSLGSFLAGALAARDRRVKALVVAAGGDLPPGPLTTFARPIMDPLTNVRALAGRPLLVAAGRRDRTMTPAQAEALFAAAGEPKEIRWYDSGHILPPSAADDVANWLRQHV